MALSFTKSSQVPDSLVTAATEWMENEKHTYAIMEKNTLYHILNEYGMEETYDGGPEHVSVIIGNENRTWNPFGGGIEKNPTDVSTGFYRVAWEPIMISQFIVIPTSDKLYNSGSAKRVDLYNGYLDQGFETIANRYSTMMYNDGTNDNEFDGLGAIIQDDGGGVYATIDPDAQNIPGWKNVYRDTGANPTYATITGAIDWVQAHINIGMGVPPLGLTTIDHWLKIVAGQRANTRFIGSSSNALKSWEGKNYIDHNGTILMFDRNNNFGDEDQKIYMINPKYMGIKTHKDANWALKEVQPEPGVYAEMTSMLYMGFMYCKARKAQGLVFTS